MGRRWRRHCPKPRILPCRCYPQVLQEDLHSGHLSISFGDRSKEVSVFCKLWGIEATLCHKVNSILSFCSLSCVRRVEAMGLKDIVTVVEHDFTADSVFKVLPALGSVDAITMSYSFSMIPNQKAAMSNSVKLLKKGGLVLVADFFRKGNFDHCLPPFSRKLREMESSFHKGWFAMDHVHLLSDEQLETCSPELETIWDNRFRGGVPFLPFLQPYHGVYVMKKK